VKKMIATTFVSVLTLASFAQAGCDNQSVYTPMDSMKTELNCLIKPDASCASAVDSLNAMKADSATAQSALSAGKDAATSAAIASDFSGLNAAIDQTLAAEQSGGATAIAAGIQAIKDSMKKGHEDFR